MGAVALSQKDENILASLQEALKIPSKSQVIHRALEKLQQMVERERLAHEIRQSVQKCGQLDREEHGQLTGSAFHRLQKE